MLKPSLLSALIIIMLAILKELPVTLILGSATGRRTLAFEYGIVIMRPLGRCGQPRPCALWYRIDTDGPHPSRRQHV